MENPILDQDQSESPSLVFATFWERVGASFIDGLIFVPVGILNFYNTLHIKSLALALVLNVPFIIYKIYMEGTSGATIGKRSMKIKVVTESGGPIDLVRAGTRACFYILNMLGSMISTIMVFNAAGFADVTGWMEIGSFQNENGLSFDLAITALVFISVIFVAFDKNKQALHDKIAKTYCVKV